MKRNDRNEKLTALQAVIRGDTSTLRQYQCKQPGTFYMVVCSGKDPGPTDLVEVRLADPEGQKQIRYADFIKNPVAYGSFCITVDEHL